MAMESVKSFRGAVEIRTKALFYLGESSAEPWIPS